jgi:hypothetical protein
MEPEKFWNYMFLMKSVGISTPHQIILLFGGPDYLQ